MTEHISIPELERLCSYSLKASRERREERLDSWFFPKLLGLIFLGWLGYVLIWAAM